MNRCKFLTAFRLESNGLSGIPVRLNFNDCMSFTKEGVPNNLQRSGQNSICIRKEDEKDTAFYLHALASRSNGNWVVFFLTEISSDSAPR